MKSRRMPFGFFWAAVIATLVSNAGTAWAVAPAHVVIVTDRSGTIERKNGAACNAVATMVYDVLTSEPGSLFAEGAALGGLAIQKKKSSVSVLATGADATPRVPVEIVSVVSPKVDINMGTPPAVAKEQTAEALKEIRTKVFEACMKEAVPQKTSPIYAAAKAGAERLRNLCMAADSECLLIVQSDLEETDETTLAKAVQASGAGKPLPKAALPSGLEFGGTISVFVCGIGQSSSSSKQVNKDRIVELWKQQIFSGAKRFVVQSQCPGYAATP